ncbi:MAG: PHP domain-containing protein, partial [Candidatus Omnitrophica bacterium]|nr:PHP domain-containing protein [Candidatus Omnitrophota bacterium]
MLLEIHCHTSKHSRCSHVDPVTVVKQILKKQLQGLILTEHHYLWSGDEILELRKKAEVSESFVILSGQEVETDIGHVVVYGAPVTIPGRMKLGELRVSFPEAALIWAHPFRNGKRPDREALLDKRLDAVEIFSSNHTPKENYLGLAMWHELKFTAVSGTDTHSETTAGILPTQLDHPVKTVSDFAGEIKAARCRPFFKEIPHAGSNIVVTEITLGTKGETEIRDRIIIKEFTDEKKWNKAKETVAILEGLYAKGLSDGEFRVPRVIDVNDPSRIVIEEGQRGKNLFELISTVTPASGREYFRLAARWLSSFHYCGCLAGAAIQDPGREDKKFASYLKSFRETHSPYVRLAEEI